MLLRSTILSWEEGNRTDSAYFSTFYIFQFFPAPRSFASERSVESTSTIFETFAFELETYLHSRPIFAPLFFLRFFAIVVLFVRRKNLRRRRLRLEKTIRTQGAFRCITAVGTRRLLSFPSYDVISNSTWQWETRMVEGKRKTRKRHSRSYKYTERRGQGERAIGL